MRLELMIEGQEGVTWPQWQAIAHACEQHGIRTLFRSDHYMNLDGQHPERGALDALGTCIALGAVTTELRLGTMVSPASFRHPSVLAKLATTADVVSGGRLELGVGAGWHEREHAAYGFPFYDGRRRHQVLAEQLQIIHGHWASGEFSFSGEYYELDRLDAQPKPIQKPHPPLLMGGQAGPKASLLAAKYADEYNTAFATVDEVRERKARIDAACAQLERAPIPFSVMTAVVVGSDHADLQARARRTAAFEGLDPEQLLSAPPAGWIFGTLEQAAGQLDALKRAGVSRVLCQLKPHDDLEAIEIIGRRLAPLVA